MARFDPAEALRQTRKAARDAAERVGQQRVQRLLKGAAADLNKRLREAPDLAGSGRETFTAVRMRATLAQVQDATKLLNRGMKGALLVQASGAAEQATEHLVSYMQGAEKLYRGSSVPLRLDEAVLLDRAASGARSSVLRRIAEGPEQTPEEAGRDPTARMGVLQRYGLETVGSFEEVLQRGMVTNASWADVRDGLVDESPFLQGAPKFWAERIIRTETMGAAGNASNEVVKAADEELGDMVKILSAVFDDRTGWDSYQVHGQIRRPAEPFEWADGAYMHPPNRSNDREVVVPHRIAWPLPPNLNPRSDEEVVERYFQQRKTGSPGPRPVMSTVARNRFGR